MLAGEAGRVRTAAGWGIHDIGRYFDGSIQPKFRFDPAHGQVVLERIGNS